ncbi:MAG: sugar O-acetyltransferase [Anaerotruncus massiliensis (ex Togo et al. 2019)]
MRTRSAPTWSRPCGLITASTPSVGERFYANFGLTVLDSAQVIIGDYVEIGPNVDIYTATHPLDPTARATGLEYGKPVRIGNHVWIGGHTVINPGVTIGDNTVIGSGSVVTRDIPAGVLAAGNPCRVIRKIVESL